MNAGRIRCVLWNFCLCLLACLLFSIPAQASRAAVVPVTIKGKFDYQKAYDVLKRTNAIRKSKGLSALTMDADLLEAAMQRAAEISLVFTHRRPDKTMCFSAAPDKMIGENIALGQQSAKEVVKAWRKSRSHYENIVNPQYQSIGIGCFNYNGTLYWTQTFGNRSARIFSMPLSSKTVEVPIDLDLSLARKYLYATSSKGKKLKPGELTEIKLYFYSTLSGYESFSPVRLSWNNFFLKNGSKKILSVNTSGKVRALKNSTDGIGKLEIVSRHNKRFKKKITLQVRASSKRVIHLHANGGSFGKNSSEKVKKITRTYKNSYGKLPTPIRKGYTFKGWYTKASGGRRITSNSTVKISSKNPQHLYAHWRRQKSRK